MKIVVAGRIRFRVACVVCGGPRTHRSKSGRCWTCYVGHPPLVRTAPNVYKHPCQKCDALVSHASTLCQSCEMRRRLKAGIVKPGNNAAKTLQRDERGWWIPKSEEHPG